MEINSIKPALQRLSIKTAEEDNSDPSKDVGTLARAANRAAEEDKEDSEQVAKAPARDSEEQEVQKGLDLTA